MLAILPANIERDRLLALAAWVMIISRLRTVRFRSRFSRNNR